MNSSSLSSVWWIILATYFTLSTPTLFTTWFLKLLWRNASAMACSVCRILLWWDHESSREETSIVIKFTNFAFNNCSTSGINFRYLLVILGLDPKKNMIYYYYDLIMVISILKIEAWNWHRSTIIAVTMMTTLFNEACVFILLSIGFFLLIIRAFRKFPIWFIKGIHTGHGLEKVLRNFINIKIILMNLHTTILY